MTLELTLVGDTQIIATRQFAAPPSLVYRAHIDPQIIRKWMVGSDGWTIDTISVDARVGGEFTYRYNGPDNDSFAITGTFMELDPGQRILHIERMLMPDPTPDNRIETVFDAQGSGTLMTMTMTLPDAETRQMLMDMGIQTGMEGSYAGLDDAVSG
ncbi:SRPBCC domain-containing protein [Loktanella sp. TSTF-M6]|uniref:SRPBCC domain-containing protein n=1 Tax=Loktanella gaetbuli TaxID=2881335 RepID=A0ABS8BUJ4_9RHOB|nr:SRPBCC domain-containing protein [Loktanella gaetbuli]MCB5199393.1 SRPBCC domain-containing protein [Loktanella gaetbuli]